MDHFFQLVFGDGRFRRVESSLKITSLRNYLYWEKVSVDKFSREMTSLRNFLKVSFNPIIKIYLC